MADSSHNSGKTDYPAPPSVFLSHVVLLRLIATDCRSLFCLNFLLQALHYPDDFFYLPYFPYPWNGDYIGELKKIFKGEVDKKERRYVTVPGKYGQPATKKYVTMYKFPPLNRCRHLFARYTNINIEWEPVETVSDDMILMENEKVSNVLSFPGDVGVF